MDPNGENGTSEEPLPLENENGNDDDGAVVEDSPQDASKQGGNGEDATTEEKKLFDGDMAIVDDPQNEVEFSQPVDNIATTANKRSEAVEDVPAGDLVTLQANEEILKSSSSEEKFHEHQVKVDEKKTGDSSFQEEHVEDDEKKDSEFPPSSTIDSSSPEAAASDVVFDGIDDLATPVSSPNRPSSLSSTPDRASSLSSTPDRSSFDQATGFEVQDDDTWTAITQRDRPLSNANAIHVMDHAHTVLEKRISDATDDFNMKDNLKIFQQTLGRFQNSEIKLGRRLASGNFADIFLVTSFIPIDIEPKACNKAQKDAAEEIKMKWRPNELVIKVLRGNLLLNPSLYATAAADFITEGTLLASLDHPHIVSLRGRSVTSVEGFASGKRDSVFLVLERLHGDLTHKVRQWRERQSQNRIIIKGISGLRDGRAAILRERLLAMAQLADALDYLHKRNIIHRDLKLSNVGVDARGRMKLLDFGLAKILPPSKDVNETFLLTGNTGSARYMAPEVARGEPYNLRADVYSFAILFYEVMNLDKAFQGWQARDISDRVHHKKYRPRLPLVWPASVREILRTTWSDVPNARLSMKHVHTMLVQELKDLQASM